MERENRYSVLKNKDIDKYLTLTEKEILLQLQYKVYRCRMADKKNDIRCVVVEHDWPEYEKVWAMIEARVDAEDAEEIAGIVQHDFDSYSPRILPDDNEPEPDTVDD